MAGEQKNPPAEDAKSTAKEKEEAVVKYTGTADVREITAAQWKKAGVEDQKKVVWDAKNDHTVKASEFSKEALAVLAKASNFELPEG